MLALGTFTAWTVSDTLLKLVRSTIPTGQMLLISGISGMAAVFIITMLRGHVKKLQPRNKRGLFAIGVCQCAAWILWIKALAHLPLTSMYAVAFMTPLTVASLARLALQEPLGWKRGMAIAVGFGGVIVAMNPEHLRQPGVALMPYVFVFSSMICTATQMVLLRAVGKTESSEAMSFYPRILLIIIGVLYGMSSGFVAMSPLAFLGIFFSGILGATGWALLAKAYQCAPAAAVAPFHYSQMLTGAVLGYLVWGDVPNGTLLAGAVVIIASGIYLVRHERRASRMMVRVE